MKSISYYLLIGLLIASFYTQTYAQDVHLTQFYHATTYINPAFVGTTPHYRATALYRNQWSGLSDYQFGLASFDYNLSDANSGLGFLTTFEKNSATGFSNMTFNGQYSYRIKLGKTLMLNLGLQASFLSRSIDFSNLKFEDQLLSGTATRENLPSGTKNAFDVSSGLLLYSEKIWFGLSAHHLTRPSMSLLGSEDALNMKISVHTGGKFVLDGSSNESVALMPSIIYLNQNSYQQMMVGTNLLLKPLIIGIWYRGFPLSSSSLGTINQDAIALFAGFTTNGWNVGYSYDITISGLQGSGGSHEITLSYAPWQDIRNRRGTGHIPCPITF